MEPTTVYRERLRPPLWLYAVLLLIIPAVLITFIPIDSRLGIVVAIAAYAASVAGMTLLPAVSPLLEVKNGWFRAGPASIEVRYLGQAEKLDAEDARAVMRTGWDAAAHHVTVPWLKKLVSAQVTDPSDPTTAWVVSTRRPQDLVNALTGATSTARTTSD